MHMLTIVTIHRDASDDGNMSANVQDCTVARNELVRSENATILALSQTKPRVTIAITPSRQRKETDNMLNLRNNVACVVVWKVVVLVDILWARAGQLREQKNISKT